MRPRLVKELLRPMAAPWPISARCEVSETTVTRSMALGRMKKAMVISSPSSLPLAPMLWM